VNRFPLVRELRGGSSHVIVCGTRVLVCLLLHQGVRCRDVGIYLRETKRRNRDGSTVAYLQLAHSERHPDTGLPSAKAIQTSATPTLSIARRGCRPLVGGKNYWISSDPGVDVAMVIGRDTPKLPRREATAPRCSTRHG
jgi:hypothetical protein